MLNGLHVFLRQKIAHVALHTFPQIGLEKSAPVNGMNQGKLVKPKLQIMPFPDRVGVWAVV